MKNYLNRDILKVIACISMLVDHIGLWFFPNLIILRIIGRLAFPIFAFFIAEGFYYTRNKYKYFLLLVVFACVSQIPYFLLNNCWKLNILFTFIFSVTIMLLIQNLINGKIIDKICFAFLIIIIGILIIFLDLLNLIDYGIIGIIIPICLWALRNNKIWRFSVFSFLLIVLGLLNAIITINFCFSNLIQLFAVLSIPLLLLYNGQKGNAKLKYVFYGFYPLHLTIILLISLI